MKTRIFAMLLILAMLFSLAACEQGEQGLPGVDGKDGADGADGKDGANGADGKSAYELAVENGFVGSETDWLASLEGDKGDTGAQGIQGEKGDKGDKGDTGAQGIQGEKGDKGDKGDTGAQGIQGEKGDKGDKGDTGEQGIQGEKGEKGDKGDTGEQGIQGEKGDKGDKGDTGAQGIQGEKGDQGDIGFTGKSAFQLYCEVYGYEGTEQEWLADLLSGALVKYTVTFDLNGGNAVTGYVESTEVPAGSYLDLCTPTRTGYTFVGWYTGTGVNDGIVTSTTSVRSDMSLIAKWQINEVTVTFVDYYNSVLKTQTIDYGTAAEAPVAPSVNKYKFSEWDTDFSCVTKNLIIKPIYVPNTYTVTFNTDGGTEIDDVVYYMGDIPTKPTEPTKEGYYFIDWYTDAEFTTPYAFNAALDADSVIYAKFSESIPIYTAEDLKKIADNKSANYYLANDIDMEGGSWPIITYFQGVFDGNGYKIHNFVESISFGSDTSSGSQGWGLFRTNYGTIKNVTFSDFSYSVSAQGMLLISGLIAGENQGTIDNCHIKDAVLSYNQYKSASSGEYKAYVGGIVGRNYGNITNCTIEADINGKIEMYCSAYDHYDDCYASGDLHIGGITGYNDPSIGETIKNVTTNTSMTFSSILYSNNSGNSATMFGYSLLRIGGACSHNKGTIENCNINNQVEATYTYKGGDFSGGEVYAGGFVQQNEGTISNCKASGSITVSSTNFRISNIGGFVVHNEASKNINNCYANVDITSNSTALNTDEIGGFVAKNSGTIVSCYASGDITTSSIGEVGGFVGQNQSSGTISKSFCTGNITMNNSPANVGYFVGLPEDGSTIFKSYYNSDMVVKRYSSTVTLTENGGIGETLENLLTKALLVDTLSWSEENWTIVDGELPKLSWEE